jgi:peptide/nickel transport system permease protein
MSTALQVHPAPAVPLPETTWARLWRRFAESHIAVGALVVLSAMVLLAAGAPLIAPQDPYDLGAVSIVDSELEPGSKDAAGQTFMLGTDAAGRDLFSAILYGLRISLLVGLVSAMVALVIGTMLGLIGAHLGGKVDAFIMRVVDLQLSIPAILVALMLLATLGQGVDKTLLALVIVQWAYYARTVRGSALAERRKEYVEAAMGQGLPAWRVMLFHILPNCLAPLLVTVTLQTGAAITLEATMSFLGIGLPQTRPSLGLLISNGFEYLLSNKYWISMFPGVALVVLVAAINLVGDQLRDVLNPKHGD